MTSHVSTFVKTFTVTLTAKVRGIWEIEFSLRSSPFKAWTGIDSSAVHIYDLNGDLFKIIPVRRGTIIEDPQAAGVAAALAAIENW